ncbi:MAG: glycoside hydrolase family 30 beta sandwich domain-containing protein [Vicinamibacterales bacterium]
MSGRPLLQLGAVAVLLVAACRVSSSAPDPARVSIDLKQQYQTITGWEATAEAGQEEPGAEQFVPQALDAAVDLGITRLRLEVLSGAEHRRDLWTERREGRVDERTYECLRYATVNDNSDPAVMNQDGFQFSGLDHRVATVVLPFKKRLEARGRALHLNVNYVAFTKGICGDSAYDHDRPEEYAEFVIATALHLRETFGLVADTWEAILEPDKTASWSGRQVGEAIVAAARRLRAHGFATKFVAPSCANMGTSATYFDEISKVPGAIEELAELSYHRYAGVSERSLRALASRATEHGLGTAMLEKIGASYPELHADLKIGNASSWQQFTLAYPERDNGAQYFTVSPDGESFDVRPGARTRYLRQYFAYVRPGARRIEASSNATGFDPVAFRNVDGRVVVIVEADGPGVFALDGLPAGRYETSYMTAAGNVTSVNARSIVAGTSYDAEMPGAGVLTVAAVRDVSEGAGGEGP